MICPKCGMENPDGAQQCQGCGMTLTAFDRRKKKGKGWLIAVMAAVAVLAVAAVIVLRSDGVQRMIRRRTQTPVEYYREVETANALRVSEQAEAWYGGFRSVMPNLSDFRQETALSLSLDDAARDLLATYAGADLSWLQSVGLDLNLDRAGEYAALAGVLSLNESKLIDLDIAADLDRLCIAFGIPMLSEDHTELDLTDMMGQEEQRQFRDAAEREMDLAAMLPDRETLHTVLARYLTMAMEAGQNVERTQGILTVDGISQDCDILTITYPEETVRALLRELCPALEQDRELKETVLALEKSTGREDLYTELMARVREWEDKAETLTLKQDIVMTLWVDGQDVIRGRELAAEDMKLALLCPEKDGEANYSLSCERGESSFLLTGALRGGPESREGSFSMTKDGVEYCWGTFSGFDTLRFSEGGVKGSVTFQLARECYGAMNLYWVSSRYLEGLTYTLDLESGAHESDWTLSARMQDEPYFTLRGGSSWEDRGRCGPLPETTDIQLWAMSRLFDGSLSGYLKYLSEETDLPDTIVEELKNRLLGELMG